MSLPTGVALTATYQFYKNGVLADPSVLPTAVTASNYPDGTAGPTAALTHTSTGTFTATAFSSGQASQIGTYTSYVYVSDTTLDSQYAQVAWIEVGINNVTALQTGLDFTATMKTSLNAATPASVVGAVGSVTGNVGGNVTGSVGSVLGNVAGSVASVVGNVGGNVLGSVANVLAGAQAFFAQFFTQDSGQTYSSSVNGSVVKEIASNATTSPTTIENAVWNGLTSAHSTAGSFGLLTKTDLDATVSSRLPTSSYTAPLTATTTAQAVWNGLAADYDTAATMGELLNEAGGGSGDPWAVDLPNGYTGNEAGAILYRVGTNTAQLGAFTISQQLPNLNMASQDIVAGFSYKAAYGNQIRFTITNLTFPLTQSGVSVSYVIQTDAQGSETTFVAIISDAENGYFEVDATVTQDWQASSGLPGTIKVSVSGDPVFMASRPLPVTTGQGGL